MKHKNSWPRPCRLCGYIQMGQTDHMEHYYIEHHPEDETKYGRDAAYWKEVRTREAQRRQEKG